MKFSECLKTFSSLAVCALALGCTNPLAGGSSTVEGAFNPGAPGAPVAQNFAASFNQDTDSQALILPYTADVGVLPVSCSVLNLLNVTTVQACSCVAGVCTTSVRGTTFYSGSAAFHFVLIDNEGRQSNTGLAALTINQTNRAPTLALITDRSTNEDTPAMIAMTPADADGALTCTTANFTVTSSNTTLVPNVSLALSGSWPSCQLTATPALNLSGTTTISVTLSDGIQSVARSFVLTVDPVNDAPTISNVADLSTNEDTATSAIAFTIADVDSTLTCGGSVTATSSNTTLVPNTNIVIGGTSPNCTVTVTPAANANGSSTLTLTVSDGALTASDPFVLTVTPVNDAPTISDVTNKSTNEDTATSAIPFTIADIDSTLTCTGSVTATSSNTTLVPNASIVIAGTAPNCTATITPAANANGTSTITLSVTDGALTASDTFVLTVNAVDDPPVVPGTGTQPSINQCATSPSGSINIPIIYDDVEGDLATACSVSAKSTSLQGTAACTCTAGACKVTGLTPTSTFVNAMAVHTDSTITTALTYTVTANGATSASGSINVTVKTGTWSPACLGTGLSLWLDANDATTLFSDSAGTTAAVNGGAVGLWKDKSTNGRNAAQAGAANLKPTYNTTGFNSMPGVVSDGVDDMMDQQGSTTVLPGASNWIHVFAIRYLDGSGSIMDWGGGADYNSLMPDHLTYGTLLGPGGAPWIGQSGPATVKTFGARGGANTASIGTIARVTSGALSVYLNGAATASRSGTAGATPNGRYRLFQRLVPGNELVKSEMGEYVSVNFGSGAIDAPTRDRLEGYLAFKWGLSAGLPSGHTYKSYAP